MASVIVCGGSVLGLATGMLLARDGHAVTVLEADPAPVPAGPEQAWHGWHRRGVPQFRQPHTLFPRLRHLLDTELPEVSEALVAAGCVSGHLFDAMPPILRDQPPQPGDERFALFTGRRPVVELAFARAAEQHSGLTVRRGTRIDGFTSDGSGPPHITGVVADGEPLTADLVVDAMGRRSPGLDWLVAAGATAPQLESSDAGFVYYTRFFAGPTPPRPIGPPSMHVGAFSVLTLHGDNETWSITLYGSNRDPQFKHVRDDEVFTRVVHALPLQAHWLQGEPITDVLPIAGVLDRYRRFVVDGRPVALGYAAVGDASACTNPSAGRGLTVGMVQAVALRDAFRTAAGDAEAFALGYDDATERQVTPWFRLQRKVDRERFAQIAALRADREPPPADEKAQAFGLAMTRDPVVLRAFAETVSCYALPEQVLARPEIAARIEPYLGVVPPQMPAPSRERLEQLLV